MNASIETATRNVFTIGTKSNRIHWIRVFAQMLHTLAVFDVPQTNGGVERCAKVVLFIIYLFIFIYLPRQYATLWRPLNRVDLLIVCFQIPNAFVAFHCPNLRIWFSLLYLNKFLENTQMMC
jgi:hypothetical protein